MSQHFFYRLGLTILFISTNVLPMQENLPLVHSKNSEKKESKNDVTPISSPLSVSYLKQQSIALESNNTNLYSLIFNRNEQPCITHYLLNGKQVAQLTQIRDEINFESSDNSTHGFSLQIPYQVGSLNLTTQGQLALDRKITAYSAHITGKKINFLDYFLSDSGLIIEADRCKTHASLTCSDFLFSGKKFEITSKSSLTSNNSLTLTATSLLSNKGTINCAKESFIKSLLFKNSGTFNSYLMHFDGNKIINEEMIRIGDSFHCASQIFEHSGMLDVFHDFITKKGDIFSSTPSSVININGDWKSFITSFYLQGSLNVKNLLLTGKKFTVKSPFHCIAENAQLKMDDDVINEGVIKVLGLLDIDSKNITLPQTSNITVENANLKTHQSIENSGTLSIKNNLSGRAYSISNKGKIQTNSADIKADRYFYNAILSQLNVKNTLTINTPLSINLLGLTHAQYVTINSIIGLNALGMYAAKSLSRNSLFSVNAGLLLPKFSSFAEMYSWQNLRGLGESLFIKHVPMFGVIYSTLKNIQGIYQQGKSICSELGSIYKQRGIGASDLIALVCLTKSMMSSVRQTSNLGQQSYFFLSNSSPQAENAQKLPISNAIADKAKDIAQQMPSTLLSHYGSSVTTDTVVDHNYGVAIGINNNTSSLYSYNENTSLYVNNNIDTYSGENTGYLGGYNLNIKATNQYSSNGNVQVSDANIDAYNLHINGQMNAHKNINLEGKTLANINGNIKAEKTNIKSDNEIKISADLVSPCAYLHAKKITQNNIIKAPECLVLEGDNIINNGLIRTPKMIVNQINQDSNKEQGGSINKDNVESSIPLIDNVKNTLLSVHNGINKYFEKNIEHLKNYNLKNNDVHGFVNDTPPIEHALINPGVSTSANNSNPKLLIVATRSSGGDTTGYPISDSYSTFLPQKSTRESVTLFPAHYISFKVPTRTIEQQILGNSTSHTPQGELTFDLMPKDITYPENFDNNSCSTYKNGFVNRGNLEISDQLIANAQNIYLDEQSHIDTQNAYFKSDSNWENNGKIDAKNLGIDAQNTATNTGSLNISDLQIKSQDLTLKKESNIAAKNSHFQVDSWQNDGKLKSTQCSVDAQKTAINNGELDATELLHVKAQNVTLKKESNIAAKNSHFQVDFWQNDGKLKSTQCSIDAQKKVINNGIIDATELLHVKAQNVALKKESNIAAKNSHFQVDFWQNDGKLKSTQCSIDAQKKVINNGIIDAIELLHVKAQNISLRSKSNVKTKNAYYKADQNVFLNGTMDIERGTVDAGGSVRAIGKIGASDHLKINARDITFEKTANVSTNQAFLEAMSTIANGGKFTADVLSAHAKYVVNSGEMIIKKSGHISADRLFCNVLGSISGEKNLTIDTLILLNTAGYIGAKSLCTNSIIDLNLLGIYQARNLSQNSIFAYNAGISLPRFKSFHYIEELVTKKNLLKLCEVVGKKYLPRLSMVYSLYKFCKSSDQDKQKLIAPLENFLQRIDNVCKKKDLCLNDIVPILFQGKNLLNSAAQITQQTFNLIPNFNETKNNFISATNQTKKFASDYWNHKIDRKDVHKNIINSCKSNIAPAAISSIGAIASGAASASVFGSQLSRDSLVDINSGLMLGVNASSQSLYNANFGISLFANNNSISTRSGTNTGLIGGGNTSLDASQSYSSSGRLAGINVSAAANNLAITGNTYALNTSLKAHENATIDAEINSYGTTAIDAKTLHLQDNSKIDANTAQITAQSIKGEKGNIITTRNGTIMKANKLDNSGTTNGEIGLDFGGKESDLKSIGNVKDITYGGTLDNGLVDRLANGHNSLLNVENGGSVAISAGQQNVHLKEQHDMGHTLHVQTEGSIKCDKNLSSEKSTILEAKGDIDHEWIESQETTALRGNNISSGGHVTRQEHGDNYKDVATESKVSGKQVIIAAENDLNYKGTHVHSGTGGTQAYVGNNLNSDTFKLEERRTSEDRQMGTHRKNKEQSFTKQEDTFTTHTPNTFSSDGKTDIYVKNTANLAATVFDSAGGTTIEAGLFVEQPVYDTHTQKVETRTRKFMRTEKAATESYTKTLRPIEFKEKTDPTIISENPVSLHLKCEAPSITIDAPKVELLLPKTTTIKDRAEENIDVKFWDRAKNKKWRDTVHGPSYGGTLNTNAESIHVEDSEHSAPTIINPTSSNPSITRPLVKDVHEYHEEVIRNRPTPLLINTAALVVSVATQGLGASLGIAFKAGLAGINAFGLNAAHTFLQCDGNYKDAAKQILKPQALRAIATAALISAATLGADQGLNKIIPQLSQATTLMQRLVYTAPREIVRGGIGCVGDIALGKNPKEAIKNNSKSAAANTLGSALSSQIGQLYGDKKIDPLTHKLLHASVGAAEGAIVNGKKGALAGAIGAGVAETVADLACPKPPCLESILHVESQLGRSLTKNEFAHEWNKQTIQYLKQSRSVGDASKIVAATVATIANQDMNTAYNTATKAVDHNFLVLAGYAIAGISTAHSAYQIHKTYQEEGAVEALKHLGVEVISNIACVGAGKVLFKVGSKAYPSAKIAVNIALDAYPSLKLVLGNTVETLITGAQLFAQTGVGKKIIGANQWINSCTNPLEKNLLNAKSAIPTSIVDNAEKQLAKKASKKSAEQLALPAPKKNPLLAAPLKTNNPNIKPTNSLSEAKRELTKKPAGTLPKQITKRTDSSGNLQAEKGLNRSSSNPKNTRSQVDKSSVVNKEKLPETKSIQDEMKPAIRTENLNDNKATLTDLQETPKLADPGSVNHKSEISLVDKVIQPSGRIKSFPAFKDVEEHVFSKDHIKNGILELGPTRAAINEQLIDIIKKADSKNLLQEGPNNIVTFINDKEATVRVFIENNIVRSYNAFTKTSNRKVKNIIYL